MPTIDSNVYFRNYLKTNLFMKSCKMIDVKGHKQIKMIVTSFKIKANKVLFSLTTFYAEPPVTGANKNNSMCSKAEYLIWECLIITM